MHNLSKEDSEKSERHKILTKQLNEIRAEHLKVSEEHFSGKASDEELMKVKEKLQKIQEELRKTSVPLKRKN